MDDKQKPLSASEIRALRDELARQEKLTWLRRLLRTGAAWTAGTLTAAWAMLDDQSPSLFWSAQDVAAGALEAASPEALREPFVRLSAAHPAS